jgi:hypothetical protein
MGGWLQWGIPLVGLAVWILSNLIKNQQDEARRREMRPRPSNPQDADMAQRREPPPRKLDRPRPPLRPQSVPAQDRPRQRSEADSVRSPRRLQPATEQPIVMAQLVLPPATLAINIPPTVSANRKPTKAIQNLHALLKSRNTVATAVLLTEVLGKPRCRRR